MTINILVRHIERFISGDEISIKWAKEAETILDELPDDIGLEDCLDEFQERLSLYRPGGGDYLIDEAEMRRFCIYLTTTILQKYPPL